MHCKLATEPALPRRLAALRSSACCRIVGQMLLLNSIDALDLDSNTIEGRLALHDDDPVFDGHFPR